MQEETGARIAVVVRAYLLTREIFDFESFWQTVEALDNKSAGRGAVRHAGCLGEVDVASNPMVFDFDDPNPNNRIRLGVFPLKW
jgi:hypothetical protein